MRIRGISPAPISIFSVSFLPIVNDTFGYFGMRDRSHVTLVAFRIFGQDVLYEQLGVGTFTRDLISVHTVQRMALQREKSISPMAFRWWSDGCKRLYARWVRFLFACRSLCNVQ